MATAEFSKLRSQISEKIYPFSEIRESVILVCMCVCVCSVMSDKRSNPTSKEWWLGRLRRAERSYSTFKVRRGGGEKIPLVHGKEQQHFAGATVKRYPTSKVRETQVRQ